MAAEFDILNGFVDPKALDAFKQLEAQAERTAKSMKEIALQKDAIFGGTSKGGVSKTQEKLVADLERANAKMKELNAKHQNAMVELEAKLQRQLLEQKQKHDNAMTASQSKANDTLIKEKEKLNARLFELELKINAEATKNREKFENDSLKSQQDFDNKLVLEKQKIQNKLAELDAKELARQKDYDKRRADSLADKAARDAAAAQKAANKPTPLTPEQKATASVATSNTAAVLKLNAIAADQNSTALQKMYATMKLLEIEMQSKFNPALTEQSQEFRNLNAQHQKLQQEYQRTARATGVMGRSMNSTYGSTFQLTQVMRELPNFAIDARIGFMALSNNLPMLADSFKQLKQQIIDTEGAAGATMKTWKVFAKSLLSLNTIMIVASTLLVLFGDDIMGVVEKLWKGGDAAKYFSEQLSKMQTEVFGKMKDDASKIMQFSLDYYSARKKGDKEVIKSLEERGEKEFGLHKNQLDMIAENVNNWRTAFDTYLKIAQITYQNEFRLKAGAEAEFNAKRAAVQRGQAENDLRAYLKTKFKDMPGGMTADERINMTIENMKAGKTTGLIKIAGDLEERWAAANKEVIKFNDELDELQKISVTAIVPKLDPNKNKPKGEKKKTLIDATKDFYDENRAKLLAQMNKLEEDMRETNSKGEINTFVKRTNATRAFYKIQAALHKSDKEIAIKEAEEKMTNELDSLAHKQKENEKKGFKSTTDYENAVAIVKENFRLKEAEITDKYNLQEQQAEIDQNNKMLAIKKGMHERELYQLEQFRKRGDAQTDRNAKVETAKNKRGTGGVLGKIGSMITGKKVTKPQAGIDLKATNEKLTTEQTSLQLELNSLTTTEERKAEIMQRFEEINLERKKAYYDAMAEAEATAYADMEKTVEENEQLVAKIIDEVWEQAWKKYANELEEQSKIQGKIEDEKYKDIEDREKAGVITKKEAEEEKANTEAYYASVQEEIDRKKAEAEQAKFLAEQAIAIGKIWILFAQTSQAYALQSALFPPLTPLYTAATGAALTNAILSTALVAAQSIPAFKDGVENFEGGKAIVGDGYKNEFVYNPITKKGYITPDVPTLVTLDKGSNVYPDINKLDLDSYNMSQYRLPMIHQDDRLLEEMKMLRGDLRRQKSPQINGMRLMQQMQYAEKSLSNRRGLLN